MKKYSAPFVRTSLALATNLHCPISRRIIRRMQYPSFTLRATKSNISMSKPPLFYPASAAAFSTASTKSLCHHLQTHPVLTRSLNPNQHAPIFSRAAGPRAARRAPRAKRAGGGRPLVPRRCPPHPKLPDLAPRPPLSSRDAGLNPESALARVRPAGGPCSPRPAALTSRRRPAAGDSPPTPPPPPAHHRRRRG